MRPVTYVTSYVDGAVWSAGGFAALDLSRAIVDSGPSPAGNAGPYLRAPHRTDGTTHRIYPLHAEEWPVRDDSGVWMWGTAHDAAYADLVELARVVVRPLYADSDPASLLRVLRHGAAYVMARHGIEYDPAVCPLCTPIPVCDDMDLGGDSVTMHMEHGPNCAARHGGRFIYDPPRQ